MFIIFNYLLHENFKPAEALQVLYSTIMWFEKRFAAEYGWVMSLVHTVIASTAHLCVLRPQRRLHPDTLKSL